jgi:predicted glycoside hydrolase/deacetylase ChbG (UPF0249 family)
MTRIWLIADDYGISRSVNSAIRDLIARGRLSGTSVMVGAPGFDAREAALLAAAVVERSAAIGLHLTLTAPFRPLAKAYRPLREEKFLSLRRTFVFGLIGQLERPSLAAEIRAQLAAFISAFDRPPDFVDGHQHVQLLPPVADTLIPAMKELAPGAWLRQCGRTPAMPEPEAKARVLTLLNGGLRARAARNGIPTNSSFAGTYNFNAEPQYDALFPTFLDGLSENGLVMCHPGIVDDDLRNLDPLTTLREHEYAYFRSDPFLRALEERRLSLR